MPMLPPFRPGVARGFALLAGLFAGLLAGLFAATLTACGTERTDGAGGEDRSDGPLRIEAQRRTSIGRTAGPTEYLFGDVTSVAADPDGRIYVADRIGSFLRVFDAGGSFLQRIGREGRGPGEFEAPADLVFDRDGRLYVRDAIRITVFEGRTPGAVPDSVAWTWRIPGLPDVRSRRAGIDERGRYHYPRLVLPRNRDPAAFYLVYGPDGQDGDTLRVPPLPGMERLRPSWVRLSASGGRIVPGLSRGPFDPYPVWDATPSGTVVSAAGADFELIETDLRGDTVRRIDGWRDPPGPVPSAERRDSLRALDARIDSLPVPVDQVVGVSDAVLERTVPERLPAVRGLFVGTDGRIWVRLWPAEEDDRRARFDVLAPDGGHEATVVVPAALEPDPPPYFTSSAIYGVVRDGETGVDRVVVFEHGLPRRSAAASGARTAGGG